MDSEQGVSNPNESGEVMESLGITPEEGSEGASGTEHQSESNEGEARDPLYVQKRLKQQKRAHEREIRELHAKLDSMQRPASQDQSSNESPYEPGSQDDHIHKAVSYALGQKERDESRIKNEQARAHLAKQYQGLSKHMDTVSDKYDDFDDVVRGEHSPFTAHMRDAALLLDFDHKNPGSAGEVLYHLGKNPDELEKISKLHPMEQAREMVKLSKALIGVGATKTQSGSSKIMGQIKNTPVNNSTAVTEKTSIGSLRERMKSGAWK